MGRAPCCDKANVKRGPWSPEEDAMLKAYIDNYGTGGNWIALPHKIGLKRCGKSCRLRWLNYLRPNIKHGGFSEEEDNIICNLYISIGSRWSIIAAQLPGRTDNDIKNYWNTRLKKKLFGRRKHASMKAFAMKDADVVDNVNQDYSSELSNSALERLQLHMQLQNPLSNFYNNPALWPKLHPLVQQRMIQSLQLLNLKTDEQFQQQSPQDHGPSIECANCSMSGSQSDNERPAADFYENMSFTSLPALHHDSLAVSTVKVDDPEPFYCNVVPENRSSRTLTSLVPLDYSMMMSQSFANTQVTELDNTEDMRRGGVMPQEEQIPQLDYFKESNHIFKDSLVWWSTNDLESRSGPSVSCDATSFLHCEGTY